MTMKVDTDKMLDLKYGSVGVRGCMTSSIDTMKINSLEVGLYESHIKMNDGSIDIDSTRLISIMLDTLTSDESITSKNDNIAYKLLVSEDTCQAGGISPDVNTDDNSHDDENSSSNDSLLNSSWKWQLAMLIMASFSCLVLLLLAYSHWGIVKRRHILPCMQYISGSFLTINSDGNKNNKNNSSRSNNLSNTKSTRTVITSGGEETIRPSHVIEDGDDAYDHDDDDKESFFSAVWNKYDFKQALVFHHKIPLWIRILIPICILGDIALFIDSNSCSDAVSVMVKLTIGTKIIDPGSVFDFGLLSTVEDMWDAKVYALATLIAFFSGLWPYIKLVTMLLCWAIPPGLLSISYRQTSLVVLDVLGKWSLIDFFVMILMLCAFYFNIVILKDNIIVNVTVLPKWGFYSFLLATMISLGIGHIILACHRLIVEPKIPTVSNRKSRYDLDDHDHNHDHDDDSVLSSIDECTSLSTMTYEMKLSSCEVPKSVPSNLTSRDGSIMYINITTFGSMITVTAIAINIFLLINGTFIDSVEFNFKGLVGLLLKDDAIVDYSYVTVGTSTPGHSGHPNDFSVRWMQCCFFLFGQAMPLGLMVALTIVWLIPLPLMRLQQLMVLAEVMNAWSALDVWCVAILASLLEIQQFAKFIVGDSCDGINTYLKQYLSAYLDGDNVCFDVEASLKEVGRWMDG